MKTLDAEVKYYVLLYSLIKKEEELKKILGNMKIYKNHREVTIK